MYSVEFTDTAETDLSKLPNPIAQRILNKIRWLAENFDAITPKALTGPWQGVFRLRVGDYRVLYTVNSAESKIVVHFIRHRREIYKIS